MNTPPRQGPAASATQARKKDALVQALLALCTEQSVHTASIERAAARVEMPLSEALHYYPNVQAVITEYVDRADKASLMEADTLRADDPLSERLFAVVMAHMDALKPICLLLHDVARWPVGGVDAFALMPRFISSMDLLLEAAGGCAHGMGRALHVQGLWMVYGHTLRTWIEDESEDCSHTMATLDGALRRAGQVGQWLPAFLRLQ